METWAITRYEIYLAVQYRQIFFDKQLLMLSYSSRAGKYCSYISLKAFVLFIHYHKNAKNEVP